MEQGLLHLKSVIRWLILLFALITIIKSITGMSGKRMFTKSDKTPALMLLIFSDLQLLAGLTVAAMKNWFTVIGAGGMTASAYNRFWTMEHMMPMLIAIILVHIGYAGIKKAIPDVKKFRRLFWCTLIALILMLAAIPWPSREGVGRPLFPGMALNQAAAE